ncbi:MAG: hypothetical protein HC799_00755 [Limnothrix sp. RL_2_0]|nr:hypothetical protein [Limnothrix sp. RL_2_0]
MELLGSVWKTSPILAQKLTFHIMGGVGGCKVWWVGGWGDRRQIIQ